MHRTLLLVVLGYVTALAVQEETVVVNLRDPHPIAGDVSILNPIPHSEAANITDAIVSPAARDESPLWTELGMIETDGFTYVTLSLLGQPRGGTGEVGSIGLVLIPEDESILRALNEGEVHLALEAVAEPVPGGSLYFSGSQAGLPIAFPQYRVFGYNTTDRAVSVNAFAYLTH